MQFPCHCARFHGTTAVPTSATRVPFSEKTRSIFVLTCNQSFNSSYYPSLPSWRRGFDSLHPLQNCKAARLSGSAPLQSYFQHSHWQYLVGEESVNLAVGLIDGHIGQRARLSASTVSGLSLVIRQMVAVSKPIAMHSRALLIFSPALPSALASACPSALASVRSEM